MTYRSTHSLAAATSVAVFLLLVMAGRVLGPLDFGRLSFALALAFLFEPLLDPGLSHLTIREVARERESAGMYLIHAIGWKLLFVPVLFLFLRWLLPKIDSSAAAINAVFLIAGSAVLNSVTGAVRAVFLAGGQAAREAATRAGGNLCLMAAGLLTLAAGGGLHGIAVSFLAVRAGELALSWALVRRDLGGLSFRVEPTFLGRMITAGAPVASFYVTALLYGQISIVGLAWIGTQTEVGQLSAAMLLFDALLLPPLALGAFLQPRLERRHDGDEAAFSLLLRSGLRYSYAVGLLVGGNAILLSSPLMRFFFGEGYGPAADAFVLLAAALPATFALHLLNMALLSMGRLRTVFASASIGILLTVALNWQLIPLRSHLGAAASIVGVQAVLFLALFVIVRRRIPGVASAIFGHLTLCAVPAVGAAWFAGRWGTGAQLACGNMVFLALALMSGFVREDERRAVLDRFSRR